MGCQQGGSGRGCYHRGSGNPWVDPSARAWFAESSAIPALGADSVILEGTFTEGSACIFRLCFIGRNSYADGSCGNRPTGSNDHQYLLRSTEGVVDGTGTVISEYGSFPRQHGPLKRALSSPVLRAPHHEWQRRDAVKPYLSPGSMQAVGTRKLPRLSLVMQFACIELRESS